MEKTMIFSEDLASVLELSQKIASDLNHDQYSSAHVLKALLNRNFPLLKELEKMGFDVFFMEEWVDVRLEDLPKSMNTNIPIADESVETVLEEADEVKDLLGSSEIDLISTIVALATPGVGFNFDQMKSFPTTRAELLKNLNQDHLSESNVLENLPTNRSSTKLLQQYCHNKNAEVKKNPINIIGRDKEIKEISEILCRYSKPNVLLQGYPGVGKTAIIKGFVQQINAGQVPNRLLDTEVYELDLSTLIAGASFRGEIDDRLKKLLKELRQQPKSILVIDGLHILLDKHTDNSGISSILKSEVEKGLTLIATTTVDEFTKKIERDENLSSLFESIKVEEPKDEDAFRMIHSAITSFEKHHQAQIGDDSIVEAIQLSKRYLKEKSLPESALNLLDRTMSVKATSLKTFLLNLPKYQEQIDALLLDQSDEALRRAKWLFDDFVISNNYLLIANDLKPEDTPEAQAEILDSIQELINQLTSQSENEQVSVEALDLKTIVAQKTNIPVGKLQSTEMEKLQQMDSILKKRVVGQDVAVQIVTDAIVEARSGLQKKGQPIGSFFFLGPTGTGKTELAKSLADFMFQDENAITRFDMSEFKEEHSAALLYGAPPGYVGYEEGGLLVNKIRQKPYSIVLFDEIEKAHSSVFDVFLQIMDEGKLHDRLGKEGDFSNALILFTSNIGSQRIIKSIEEDGVHPTSQDLMEIMSGYFRPEFLGRLTEIIPFGPITQENALGIFEIHLQKELYDLLEKQNISIDISSEAKEFLVTRGFNSTYGARPIKGIIRSELRRPIARKIVNGDIKENSQIQVSLGDDEIIWTIN